MKLKLYIAGNPSQTQTLELRLRETLDARFAERYDLKVCNILDHVSDADEDGIYATPTLMRRQPSQQIHILSDISHRSRLLAWLDSGSPEYAAAEVPRPMPEPSTLC